MTNTEKPTTKAEQMKHQIASPKKDVNKLEVKKIASPKGEQSKTDEESKAEVVESGKKQPEKKPKEKKPTGPKKTEAVINGKSLPISTKKSVAICKFIVGKKLYKAISDLEQVLTHKKVVPMKGEIPHQKGKGISSGGYPKKAVEYFIKLLKSLQANANVNGLDEPKIVHAMANLASRPYGKFGRVRKKRTHVQIKVKDKLNLKKSKK
jgi:ribosomal protein L22